MKTASIRLTAAWVLTLLITTGVSAQDPSDIIKDISRDRLAQTGMKFLSVSVDARAAALGNTLTAAAEGSSVSMLYNPASMGWMTGRADVGLGRVQWIGDIEYNYGTIAFKPLGGTYGVLGFSFVAVDYGEFDETIRFDNEAGYEKLGTFSPYALAVGVGYARTLSDRFAVGANLRYAKESLGSAVMSVESGTMDRKEFAEGVLAYDFGVFYKTGFRSLNFAMSVRNLAPEVVYFEENFELPLTFRVGFSMDMIDLMTADANTHSLLVFLDAERPRDYSEQLKIGAEYTFLQTLSLRAGYGYPTDEQGLSLGAGIQSGFSGAHVKADYAFTKFGVFGNVHRLGLAFGF